MHGSLTKSEKVNEVDFDGSVEIEDVEHEGNDQWAVIASIMQKLPATQKTILNLFYLEEQSVKQIAEILHLAEGTVKSRIFYARELLKQKIKEVNHETV